MALTTQESNFISRLQSLSAEILDVRHRIQEEVALYNAEGFGVAITDADLQEVTAFQHITQSKMWNTITALTAVTTALGDDVSGQAVNLIKMKG